MGSRRRRGMISAVVMASALLLTACGGNGTSSGDEPTLEAVAGGNPLVEAARAEGKVVWYTSTPQGDADAAAAGFEQKFGVDVEVVRLNTSVLAQRYATERDAGTVGGDVVNVADPVFLSDMASKGYLEKLSAEDVPALANWPKDAVYEGSYVLVNTQTVGVAINTTKVKKEEITSWESLLEPKFSGQIILADPAAVPTWMALLRHLRAELGDDFLADLAAQKPKLVESAFPGAQQLVAGEGSVQFPTLLSVVKPLMEQGAPIDIVYLSPTTGVLQMAGLSTDAPHPAAAKLFMDYLMSEDGQTILNREVGSSPLPNIPDTLPLPAGFLAPEIPAARAEQAEILALLR